MDYLGATARAAAGAGPDPWLVAAYERAREILDLGVEREHVNLAVGLAGALEFDDLVVVVGDGWPGFARAKGSRLPWITQAARTTRRSGTPVAAFDADARVVALAADGRDDACALALGAAFGFNRGGYVAVLVADDAAPLDELAPAVDH